MKAFFLLISLCCFQALYAQQITLDRGTTYAVVVGISDYQDEDIPDLLFADKDAEAFANFLRSPAGGSLDNDHLKLLTNEQATTGKLVAALDWLLEQVQEDDQAIIYFSGHGDVETKTRMQLGFLLTSDSPARSYMAGAYSIYFLQNIIETISLDKRAKVLLITDACRSGNLAGNAVGGPQLTSQNLSQQYANEIKILSCQPNEYSIEGEQWGGGRGAFSYHLLDGFYGMADENSDMQVSLKEIGRYLEDKVTEEVAPQYQNPMTVGNKMEKLTIVNPDLLAQLKTSKQEQIVMFNTTDSRGIEEEVLAKADSNIVELYFAFQQSLKDKQFLNPANNCTEIYYEKLIAEPTMERLHSTMTRNYAAALQDDAQQVMNRWLKSNNKEVTSSLADMAIKYKAYPQYLERAAELLGTKHYMYPILKARKLYFEGHLMHHLDTRNADRELGEKILSKYRKSLEWQPGSPHVYHNMATVYFYQMMDPDSAEHYAHKAVEAAPSWVLPYSSMGFYYNSWTVHRNMDKFRYFLELADQVDTSAMNTNYFHMSNWAIYYKNTGQFEEAESRYKKMIEYDSTLRYGNGGLAILYYQTGRHAEAELNYKKAIELDTTDWLSYVNLGALYSETGRYDEAKVQLKKGHQLNPTSLWPPIHLACVHIKMGEYEEAEEQVKKVFIKDSMFTVGYANIGVTYLGAKRYNEAERYLKKAVELDPNAIGFYDALGKVYMHTNQLKEAQQVYEKALLIDSLNTKIYSNLGLVHAKIGHYKEAEQMFQKTLALNPANSKNIYVNYAILYSLQGMTDRAFESLEQAFQEGYTKDNRHIEIMEEPSFESLREQNERWKALLKKYFPE